MDWMSEDAFYEERRERRHSREIDFGVMWRSRNAAAGDTRRITWVEATGEFYLAHGGEVAVLGAVAGEDEAEKTLEGWAERCTERGSLEWAMERIAQAERLAAFGVRQSARRRPAPTGGLAGVLGAQRPR